MDMSRIIAMLCLVIATGLAHSEPTQDPRVSDAEFEVLLKRMAPPNFEMSDYKKMREAFESGDVTVAEKQLDSIINRPISEFENPFFGYGLKSAAYSYRSKLPWRSEMERQQRWQDQKTAIELGNLPTVEEFSEGYLTKNPLTYLFASKLTKEELTQVFRTGAEFGDAFSAAAIGVSDIDLSVTDDERSYWAILAIQRDHGMSNERRESTFHHLLARVDPAQIRTTLSSYSVSGPPIPSSPVGLPPRGLRATVFVDSDLRGTFGIAFGGKTEPRSDVPDPPTVKEQFDFYSRIVPEVAPADVYLLAPIGESTQKRIIPTDAATIVNELVPGDRVFLSCGPLAHVAVLYRRERVTKKLLFIDNLYEFWQPSHNSCVKNFALVEDKHKRYLSAVDEADVAGMLQASITVRDPVSTENQELNGLGCRTLTKWLKGNEYAMEIACSEADVAKELPIFKKLGLVNQSVSEREFAKRPALATSKLMLVGARLMAKETINNNENATISVTGLHEYYTVNAGMERDVGFTLVVNADTLRSPSNENPGPETFEKASGIKFSDWYSQRRAAERSSCTCSGGFAEF